MTFLEQYHSIIPWVAVWFIGFAFILIWIGRDAAFMIRNVGYMVKSQTLAPYVFLLALIVWPISIFVYLFWIFWPRN